MEYTQVDVKNIEQLINAGTLTKMTAVKNIPVRAVELTQAMVDKMLAEGGYQTVVVDDNGKTFIETTNKKLNAGDFFVTNQIEGQDNSYIISAEKFSKLYTKSDKADVFNPVGEDRTVYMLPPNMNLKFEAPWGGEMRIRSGGVLLADGDKFYGINPEEFKATHSVKNSALDNLRQVTEKMREETINNNATLKI